ncbi:MAG: hypothetical protein AB8B87_05480 [Granulosicoccus sp.]
MKRIFQQNWSRCSWEAQLLLTAFGVTIVAHLLILSMILVLGTH